MNLSRGNHLYDPRMQKDGDVNGQWVSRGENLSDRRRWGKMENVYEKNVVVRVKSRTFLSGENRPWLFSGMISVGGKLGRPR